VSVSETTINASRLPRRLLGVWEWLRAQPFNPVLVRDARSMLRGKRAIGLQLGYIIVLTISMGGGALALYSQRAMYGGVPYASLSQFGRWMFMAMYETQVVLLLLVVIGYSAGSISLEMEKQTYDALSITRLSSIEVVVGKVSSITLLCYLLMLTSAPLAAFALVFGGVSPGEIMAAFAMLALKIPLWASLGVLASVLTGRSIGAYVLTLTLVGGENFLSATLMGPLFSGTGEAIGLFTPFAAPVAGDMGFELFGKGIPSWLLPIPYAVLLTTLMAVGAAESMHNYRPKLTAVFRAVLLGTVFFFSFAAVAIGVGSGSTATTARDVVSGILISSWIAACGLVPIFTSYPPPAEWEKAAKRTNALDPRAWFLRTPIGGGGYAVAFWAAMMAGAFVSLGLGALMLRSFRLAAVVPRGPEFGVALIIYLLSLVAYGALGTVLSLVHRSRREVGLATGLFILCMNAFGVIYVAGVNVMRKVPSQAALVLASPAAAASAFLSRGFRGSKFGRYSLDEAFMYGIGYSLVLLLIAYWYHGRHERKAQAMAVPQAEAEAAASQAAAGK
jgi:hypothetical protein